MKRMLELSLSTFLVFGFSLAAAQSAIASQAAAATPPPPTGQAFAQAVADACPVCQLLAVERRVLTGKIAEYSFPVRVGAGEHDMIRIHRVVKESAPFVPVRTSRALFMAHGDIWGFEAAFLGSLSPAVPDNQALPVFLAAHGVDVWGIDFRWTLVPATTTDLSFMAPWTIDTDARDLRLAIAIARLTRGLTGDGLGRLPLLGWSRGGQIGYAAAGAETQLPPALRQIKAFIPVDIYLKSDQPDLIASACLRLGITQSQIANGELAATSGGLLATLGQLAKTTPADPSPIVPGFTNRQAALAAGSATYLFLPPGGAFAPSYHFTGGSFDGSGLPTGLTYQGEAGFFDFLTGAAPFQPLKELADADAAVCGSPDVSFDDHLEDISLPVLYVGAAGGVGSLGIYTTTLLASSDVTTHVGSLLPPAQRALDLGHADIFQATAANTLFWQTILSWLQAH